MNRKTVLTILLPSLILIPMVLLLLLFPDGWKDGQYPITGRYVETSYGQHMIYCDPDNNEMRYFLLLPRDDNSMFDGFETGDAIRVNSSPRWEGTESGLYIVTVFEPKKVWDLATIPELTEEVLLHMETLASDVT